MTGGAAPAPMPTAATPMAAADANGAAGAAR